MNNDVELIMLDKHNMKPLIDYINELQCYKSRIDKAIEYIKLCKEETCEESDNYIDNDYALYNLLNILEGKD